MARGIKMKSFVLAATVAATLPAFGSATTSVPKDISVGDPVALTFYLTPNNMAAAEAQAVAIQTPGSPSYHHFLSEQQFVQSYGPTDAQLNSVKANLRNMGFTVGYVYGNHLAIEATATAAATESALGVHLQRFTLRGRTGIASTTPVTLPAELAGVVRAVGGIDTLTHAHPMHTIKAFGRAATPQAAPAQLVGGTPGNYLPADYASFYDVNPLYKKGYSGRGSTIGIVTLNTFNPADAYLFWQEIGLTVSPNRITMVNVDGGEAALSSADGEGETDLDVEESGALAPNAKVRVYVAPVTTNSNFLNAFEEAASENIADTVSTSWGQPELNFFRNQATGAAADTSVLLAFHDAFLEMALQGQTVFAATGDSGSFDTVADCSPYAGAPSPATPVCNAPYAIDSPSSDPLVTAAGGTTLPYTADFGDGILINIPTEQAWSWDYISNAAAAAGVPNDIPVADVFSVGGGGGVSSYWGLPWYQFFTPGITLTKPGQVFTEDTGSGPVVQNTLPAFYLGRNTPDVATDADSESGYQYIEEGQVINYYGGTSFVAPQLNGVAALFVEGLGQRVGQLSPALYQLGSSVTRGIKAGDNWGYAASGGYDNASGLGALDAAKLLNGLKALQFLP